MENNNRDELRQWVSAQTAPLAAPSAWQPDSDAALLRLRARMREDLWRPAWPRWLAWTAAAVLCGVTLLLLPAGRGIAQLWQTRTVPQVAIIRANPWPEGVPSPQIKALGIPIPPLPVRDAEEAGRRVRFQPRLPRWGVLSTSPKLFTTFSVGAGTVVRTADLELALRKAGVANQTVPVEWEGAQLALHTSGLVIAQWPDAVLVQSLPLTLTAPPGFDFLAFSAMVLRIVGIGPEEAQRLAQQTGTTPPWLAPLGADVLRDGATLEEIKLNSGPATLLTEVRRPRVSLLWMVADRVYLLSGSLTRELAIAVANAVE